MSTIYNIYDAVRPFQFRLPFDLSSGATVLEVHLETENGLVQDMIHFARSQRHARRQAQGIIGVSPVFPGSGGAGARNQR
jgi:hypothetical protein